MSTSIVSWEISNQLLNLLYDRIATNSVTFYTALSGIGDVIETSPFKLYALLSS